MASIEVAIFTKRTDKECYEHIKDCLDEWLTTYLEKEEVNSEELITEHSKGVEVDGWRCDSYVLDLEVVFEPIIGDLEFATKEQLIVVRGHLMSLLDLVEVDTYNVFKFIDAFESTLNAMFYVEISHLELSIRRMLTEIFYPKNPDLIYEILTLTKANPSNYSAEIIKKHEHGYQNEFFYLNIGEYKNLKEQKTLSRDGIAKIGEKYTDLTAFLEDLKSFGQLSPDEVTLITEVAKSMDTITGFRNCIMHSRAYSMDELDSYQRAEYEIRDAIKSYSPAIV